MSRRKIQTLQGGKREDILVWRGCLRTLPLDDLWDLSKFGHINRCTEDTIVSAYADLSLDIVVVMEVSLADCQVLTWIPVHETL